MIQISNLKKVYRDKTVIDIPELTIRDGQLTMAQARPR